MNYLLIANNNRLYRDALCAYIAMRFPDFLVEGKEAVEQSHVEINGRSLFSFQPDKISATEIVSAIARYLAGDPAPYESAGRFARITRREHDVLGHLMKGRTNKEIARELDLQVVTVKLHVRGICRKLGATNRTQAALIAQENLVE